MPRRRLALLFMILAVCVPVAVAATCGDGILDVGEGCDAGSANGAFTSCCAADCALRPPADLCRLSTGACDPAESCDGANADCPADLAPPDADADGVCDAADVCPDTPDPGQTDGDQDGRGDACDLCPINPDPGQEDGDGDGRGDLCDPCTNVIPTGVERTILKMSKLLPQAGDERLKLKATVVGIPGIPTLDPIVHGMRFLLTDSLGATLIDARLPGGVYSSLTKVGWKGGGLGWNYANSGVSVPLIQGLSKVTVRGKTSAPGLYNVVVTAKDGNYPVTPAGLPLRATIVFDTPVATTGQCAEVGFDAPSACELNSKGTLLCR